MSRIIFGIATVVVAAALTGCGGVGTGVNGNPEVLNQQNPTPSNDNNQNATVQPAPSGMNDGSSTGAPSPAPTQNPPGPGR